MAMAPDAEMNERRQLQAFFDEEEDEVVEPSTHPSRKARQVLGAFGLLAAGLGCALVSSYARRSSFIVANADSLEVKAADPEDVSPPPCLCIFDVDRTLTAAQGSFPNCPKTQAMPGVYDPAYGTGQLSLSEVGANLEKTFCSQCHIGIVTAGTGGYSQKDKKGERDVIYEKLNSASNGKAGDGKWSVATLNPPISPFIFSCPDPEKGDRAHDLVEWLNSKGLGIPPEEVYFFDDHLGNAGEMRKYGYNSREVSCKSRDQNIGDGIVGYCGAELSEIVKEKGYKSCKDHDSSKDESTK